MIRGYTLMEILIIITLVAVLAAAAIILLNPLKQIQRSQDIKRKAELSQLKKVLEDWYNDKNCYPKPREICYGENPQSPCFICGKEPNSPPSLKPYLNDLPCDPKHPQKKYLYQAENDSCPSWYRIYSVLEDYQNDPSLKDTGCYYQSCGVPPNYGYSFGVSSPNTSFETASSFVYCSPAGCNVCDTKNIEECKKNDFCQNNHSLIFPNFELCTPNCPCNY